jgi:hypothetical protein
MIKRGDELFASDESATSPTVNLVTIGIYSHPYEADLAKARLEAEGIVAFVADEFLVNLNWLYSNALGGIRLQVPEPDMEMAQQMLSDDASQEVQDSSFDEEHALACPKCGSKATEYVDLVARRVTYLSWLVVGFPILRFRNRMRCSKCRFAWKIKE